MTPPAQKTGKRKPTDSATGKRVKDAPDDPAQSERFVEMARQVGAAEDEEEAERAFKGVVKPKR